ncbi:MAG: hypothetical protein KKH01_09605 [Firmicutes bacterium]|nr:hypothetical protein [Bacillota bacterium]
MTKYEVLNQLNNNELDTTKAYNLLYKIPKERKPKKAFFLKVRIRVPESKGATIFLGILLFLPMPIVLAKLFIPRKIKNSTSPISDQLPVNFSEMLQLISMRGIKIDIKTHDNVRVYMKTI